MFRPASVFIFLCAALRFAAASEARAETISFNDHIRPILSNACFHCHGPDEKTRDADLRLDTREGAIEERDGVRAVVPGKPDESELLTRVLSHDKDDVMPPPKSKKPRLTDTEIATLRRWIEQGAEYEGHWAFLPLSKAEPPAVHARDWVKNPVDRFILARLEREGIAPSPEADRETLLRRVSLDLTGLLPSPEETAAFLTDSAPDAYERLVDRLLASPHYGERWGRHWLDGARYADSNGYTIDSERAMWPYRDWVIRALNADMPFDQFTVEQLAGDLLPKPTKSQLIATAFHRNTLINEEGGTDKEQFRVEAVMDRVNTTGAVWLGLTVGCAQCHTHKFDPITHREYYALYAFFNSTTDVNSRGATVDVARGELFGTGPTAEELSAKANAARAGAQRAWEARELQRANGAAVGAGTEWKPARFAEPRATSGGLLSPLEDGSLLLDRAAAAGKDAGALRIAATAEMKKVAAVRLRVLPHESLPGNGPGTSKNGGFVLSEIDIVTAGGGSLRIASAEASNHEPSSPVGHAFDDDPSTGWAADRLRGAEAEAVFILESPTALAEGPLEIQLRHDAAPGAIIGRFAVDFAETRPRPAASRELRAALAIAPAQRTPEQEKLVREAFDRAEPRRKEEGAQAARADAAHAQLMVMRELPQPRPTFLFQRGDFLRPDKTIGPLQPGVFAAVNAAFSNPPTTFRNRLDLAGWLVSPENPLTPRVTMNRIWLRYFGRGLVETEEDFGTQGTPPTHPELLDWLGREWIRSGWSMKAMHRLIATSATYRQSSKARPDLAERDPRNLLLARQERIRVEAEIVRDAALSASGLLDRTIGGPSVRPPQPEGVYAFTQNKKAWTAETGPNRYRRALYTTFYRSAPHPLFATFDAPDFQLTCTRRTRSNTPLQALTLANDAAFLEMAQALAARVLRELRGDGADAINARLSRAVSLALCRAASPAELAILRRFHDAQAASFAADSTAAKKLLPPALAASAEAPPAAAAALVSAARVILNSDAFITRE